MGACTFERIQKNKYKKNDFQLLKMIGRGSFGKVWKVEHRPTHQVYALKIMEKTRIIATKSVKAVICEKSILSSLSDDKTKFIINMEAAFQDTNKLYLLMNFIEGENLRYYISKNLTFTEKQIKFLAINILKALQYLHEKKIIHRDLKPENIIIDEKGFPHLTDFGIAEFYKIENSKQNGGTLNYMAPQVLSSQNHNYAVDYYALGVIIYQLFFGKRPFEGSDKSSLIRLIIKGELKFQNQKTPLSNDAKDFISKLLQKKQKHRLGYKNRQQIFDHPWLNNDSRESCYWSQEKQQVFSKHCNIMEDTRCDLNENKNVDTNSDMDNSILSNILDRPHIQQLFQAFDFIALQTEENKKQMKIQNMEYGNPESHYSLASFLKK